ncbi:MAG: hypothetical protein FWH55_13310, partial [Oscillospiraceae bacterium]|nr:hypothetical protein [Oscillospiraceae bacterium]
MDKKQTRSNKTIKKLISLILVLCLILPLGSSLSFAAPGTPGVSKALSPFAQYLESKYIDPDRVYSTDVRWWLGTAAYTT